jgi:hypothetical protein
MKKRTVPAEAPQFRPKVLPIAPINAPPTVTARAGKASPGAKAKGTVKRARTRK